MKAFHARVEGEVQGVGFRYSAQREATSLGLSGWVRNTSGGAVEVWAEGPEPDLNEFLAWLRQGPPSAWVRAVNMSWESPEGRHSGFHVAF